MRRFLSIVGGAFVVCLLVLCAFIAYTVFQGRGLDASSKAYVESSVPAISSPWSGEQLLQRAAPELKTILSKEPDQFTQLFAKLSKLGPFRSLTSVQGSSNVLYTPQGKQITAQYICHAKFDNAEGDISIRLVLRADAWKFVYFHVDSPLFLRS